MYPFLFQNTTSNYCLFTVTTENPKGIIHYLGDLSFERTRQRNFYKVSLQGKKDRQRQVHINMMIIWFLYRTINLTISFRASSESPRMVGTDFVIG